MRPVFQILCLVLMAFSVQAQIHKGYPASIYPDRVILGWQANPATSQSVNWRTDSTVTTAVGAIAEAGGRKKTEHGRGVFQPVVPGIARE